MNAGTMRIRGKGLHPAGGIQIKNEKNRPSLKTVKNDNKSEKSKYKPLWGKVFYLDLPSVVISEKLEKDLKELGGRVEEFLSKDISYLISNKKEAKYAQTLRCISPVPSPESTYTGGNSSPHPSCDGSSFKTPDPVCMSRGKLLVEKAIKEHEFIPSNSILSNALSWGVKILHIDDIKYYIEQKKKELYLIKNSSTSLREVGKRLGIQKTKTGRLKKPFVKVEDSSHHYRPFYLQLSNIPLINYSVPKPCSPFDSDKISGLQKQTQAKQRNRAGGEAEERRGHGSLVQPRLKENKKKGYCECCSQKYEALQAHLLSEQHRNFAQSTQYQVVDDIISKLVYDFVEYKSNISRRVKCTIGSFPPIIGNTFKKNGPEKQLELHCDSPNDGQGNTTKQVIKQDFQNQGSGSPSQKTTFSSDPMDSFASCSPYNSTSKLREHLDCQKPYLINPVKKDNKLDLVQLPLTKDTQGYLLEVSDYKGTITEKDLEELKTGCCPYILETFMHVSHFDETDKNVSQLKRKSDSSLFPDTHQKKKGTSSPHGTSLRVISNALEQTTSQAKIISHSPPGEELREVDIKSTDSLPSGNLHRKVKIVFGRNRKRNQKKNVELHLKNKTEFTTSREENSICSSPIQSLVELFQTSEGSSEFLGFTNYSENHGSCDVLEVWEEENENSLLSMFLSSPSSTSTFTGF